MAIWPFSIFSKDDDAAPVMEKEKQEDKPVLLKAEKDAEKTYKREVWWLEHRTGLKKGAIVAIIVFEAILGLIGIYAFVDYYLIDYVEEQQMVASFFEGAGDLRSVNARNEPLELVFTDAQSVQSGQLYDILSFVENQNEDWIAQVEYHFEYGEVSSDQDSIVVNQQTRLAITELGIEGARSRVPELVIDDIEWRKIDLHEIKDPILWKKERWNFEVIDITHDTDLLIGSRTFGRTNFTITNKTGFGYYDVPITLVLKRGSRLVGVNRTTLTNFDGLEVRNVQVDWFDNAPSASAVEIFTELNLFDEANYIPKTADEDLDRRDTRRRR